MKPFTVETKKNRLRLKLKSVTQNWSPRPMPPKPVLDPKEVLKRNPKKRVKHEKKQNCDFCDVRDGFSKNLFNIVDDLNRVLVLVHQYVWPFFYNN
jgi:hypothetical protein